LNGRTILLTQKKHGYLLPTLTGIPWRENVRPHRKHSIYQGCPLVQATSSKELQQKCHKKGKDCIFLHNQHIKNG
jgi:hypothetical protein